MYTLYKFHFLNGISEINQLFDDIVIIWPAPVCVCISLSQSGLRIWDNECFLSFSRNSTLLKCQNGPTDHPSQAKPLDLSDFLLL